MIFSQIQRFFAGRTDRTLGLDIGSGFIKIAQVVTKGERQQLTHWSKTELPVDIMEDGQIIDEERLAEVIRQCLLAGCVDSKVVNVSLGGRNIFSREIVLPTMPQNEIAEAIKWGLDEYVPYPAGSFYYDFDLMTQSSSEEKMRVLLVAAPYEIVNPLLSAVRAAELQPVAIETEPLALLRTLTKVTNCVIVDIGAQIAQITIVQHGAPLFTRIIPLGGAQFTQAVMRVTELDFDEADRLKIRQKNLLFAPNPKTPESTTPLHEELLGLAGELAREIRRTIDYFVTQNRDVVIDDIFLSGGGALLDHLLLQLSALLETPVLLHDPLKKLVIPATFEPRFLREMAQSMAVAVGLAMRGDEP